MTQDEVKAYFGPEPDPAQVERRWRNFVTAEGVLLPCYIVYLVTFWGALAQNRWLMGVYIIGGVWFMVTRPICFLYLMGKPPVMGLSPLIPSRKSRAFARLLQNRPALNDDAFYVRYYQGSPVPKEIVTRLRRCLMGLDRRMDRVIPSDCLQYLDDELDLADALERLRDEFCVKITKSDYARIDGSFAGLVDLVCERIPARSGAS